MIFAQVVVGNTPTKLVGGGVTSAGGQSVKIKNTHATDDLFIGNSDVSPSNGFSIDPGETFDLGHMETRDVLYGIRGANAITAQVLVK